MDLIAKRYVRKIPPKEHPVYPSGPTQLVQSFDRMWGFAEPAPGALRLRVDACTMETRAPRFKTVAEAVAYAASCGVTVAVPEAAQADPAPRAPVQLAIVKGSA